jgi:hypothetical protein
MANSIRTVSTIITVSMLISCGEKAREKDELNGNIISIHY